jgi:class 3 adenylate cyclase
VSRDDPSERQDVLDFKTELRRRIMGEMLDSLGAKRKRGDKPEGIVSIAFTDIEDSSGLVSRLGDKDARALIRMHDDVLRRVVRIHEGTEVERAGDGFMLAFSTATAAVLCAIDLQKAMSDEQELMSGGIRVRIGVETGEVIAEEKGYFGRTVFAASRISELSSGGQILVSQSTQLIAGPEQFSFTDLGERQLKGLSGAHRLFELAWA